MKYLRWLCVAFVGGLGAIIWWASRPKSWDVSLWR